MIRYAKINPDGSLTEVGLLEWAAWWEDAGEKFVREGGRRVAHTQITDEVYVSTIFLGLDHGFGGPSLWFESMSFGGSEDLQERYETYAEAVEGHDRMVTEVETSISSRRTL